MSSSSSPRPCVVVDTHSADGVVSVIQLTDCHLSEAPGGCLLGMDTDHSLAAVVAQVEKDGRQPDLVLVTGDLADEGAPEAYARLWERVVALCPNQFWLPGNHDDRGAMVAVADESLLPFTIEAGAWQIVMLDSQIPGEIGGRLGPEQLQALERVLALAAEAGRYSLVCLHHHPIEIGCAWLDEQRVEDAEALFAILKRYPGAKALLWGHIHQSIDRYREGLQLLATPSTCVQFAPGSEDFAADPQPPGYRWLNLHPDGRIETGVERVRGVHFDLNLKQRGYLKRD